LTHFPSSERRMNHEQVPVPSTDMRGFPGTPWPPFRTHIVNALAKKSRPALGHHPTKIKAITETLQALTHEFRSTKSPVEVNFRALVPDFPHPERATHLIHPYPAKLLAHIPYFFLSADSLSNPGDRVLDPFCGSGTVLLEAVLSGRRPVGADSNPLARLIALAKITPIDIQPLKTLLAEVIGLAASYQKGDSLPLPDVINRQYWFHPQVTQQLAALLEAIRQAADSDSLRFLEVCFSSCLRRVSFADPRLSVPVRLKHDQYETGHRLHNRTNLRLEQLPTINVLAAFESLAATNITRLQTIEPLRAENLPAAGHVGCDARALSDAHLPTDRTSVLGDGTIDLAITSPPYVGSQKYIRASSLSLGWLGLCSSSMLRTLEDRNIGREHHARAAYHTPLQTDIPQADLQLKDIRAKNPLRAHIAACYLLEMREALRETCRVLRAGGHLVLVVGNSTICSQEFDTRNYLRYTTESLGLRTNLVLTDTIHSRGLMTSRNVTASVIQRETVFLFEKK